MDNRRRMAQKRPPPSEEHDLWAKSATKLANVGETSASPALADRIIRVNKLMVEVEAAVATDDFEHFRTLHKKLTTALTEMKTAAETEQTHVTEALETLSVLKGLRTAIETTPAQDKRTKRQRMSPAVNQATAPARSSPPLIQAATRNAQSTNGGSSRQKKAAYKERRTIAFRVPTSEGRDASDAEWILARVIKVLDPNNYVVQDADPEAPAPPPEYPTTRQSMLPLPDMESKDPFRDVPAFLPGQTVLALYPETTSFYRAQIISGGPRDRNAGANKNSATYRLKFDDDEDQEKLVSAQWVVEYPSAS
ncbi:hypothetical protein AURDEDRAFT_111917 [Auricularia subglabra TFB-10046 SS5]|nr:hypothetical protein AURDEDRAFT_111917 [Auricularia subglabra TFB-10046 SS5]